MKANELMIGDWVSVLARFLETSTEGTATSGSYNLCKKNCRIDGLNGELIIIDKICSELIACEPIPLTEEILKANADGGSCSFDEYRSLYHLKSKGYHREISIEFDKTWHVPFVEITGMGHTTIKVQMQYVHEFQHALRLCGLNELADNFKIK